MPRVIQKHQGQTLAGLLQTSREVNLQELVLLEFSHSCHVRNQHAFVLLGLYDYDIIFGQDFLHKIRMKQDFDLGTMTAFGITIKMKHKTFLQ
jgi:hypothetical protein